MLDRAPRADHLDGKQAGGPGIVDPARLRPHPHTPDPALVGELLLADANSSVADVVRKARSFRAPPTRGGAALPEWSPPSRR